MENDLVNQASQVPVAPMDRTARIDPSEGCRICRPIAPQWVKRPVQNGPLAPRLALLFLAGSSERRRRAYPTPSHAPRQAQPCHQAGLLRPSKLAQTRLEPQLSPYPDALPVAHSGGSDSAIFAYALCASNLPTCCRSLPTVSGSRHPVS